MSNYDWVFWLNVTNIALGVVVVLAVLLVAYGVFWELVVRRKKHAALRDVDGEMQSMLRDEFSHSMRVPELGLTMADGGEHLHSADEIPNKETKRS
jgi:hypothetical protein